MRARWRATGADLPFGDPRPAHGVAMEGWFWRFTEPGGERVVIALCGLCRDAAGASWAVTALAADPPRLFSEGIVPTASASSSKYEVSAGDALRADADRLHVAIDDHRLQVELDEQIAWPPRLWGALGPAHLLPGLGQYWTPHLLDARVRGHATLNGERVSLDGWHAYAEKNWSRRFPTEWWWGQAHAFGDPEVTMAFAGGRLAEHPRSPTATGLVVRIGDRTVRLSVPMAYVRADASPGSWRLAGRSPRYRVEVEGHADGQPFDLPVPVPADRRTVPGAHQHLRGAMRISVWEGRGLLYEGQSRAAGLEYGRV